MIKAGEVLTVREVSKSFGAIKALQKIDLSLREGEVLAVAGENGAGKSTLMKVIAGVHKADSGEIFVAGEKVVFNSPREALAAGISIIYQELNLFSNLTIAENIHIDRLPKKAGRLDWRSLQKNAQKLLRDFGLEISPMKRVGELPVGLQQLVEILKAVSLKPKIIIMDEPTSALTPVEIENLFSIIDQLREKGASILFISHHIEEIYRICQRIVVMRDGIKVIDTKKENIRPIDLVREMIGRQVSEFYPKKKFAPGRVIFHAEHFSRAGHFQNVGFNVREKEIIGIIGLLGCGKKVLAESLAGIYPDVSGVVSVDGKSIARFTPSAVLKAGVAFLSQDRTASLFFNFSVMKNISIPILKQLSKGWRIDFKKEREVTESMAQAINIKYSNIDQEVGELSGGNRQKVLIARILETAPRVLILDDPTRGIDVGTKTEIYNLLTKFLENNGSIILFSSEAEEVLNMCDRILIMYRGRIMSEVQREKTSKEEIMYLAVGGGDRYDAKG